MSTIILWSREAEMYKNSEALRAYLNERGIVEVKEGFYRVASGLKGEEASEKLLDLAGDMMLAFDALPTGVDPRGKVLHFGNHFGIFFVDNIIDPKKHFYEKRMKVPISNNHTITEINIKQGDSNLHNYFGDISFHDRNEVGKTTDWGAKKGGEKHVISGKTYGMDIKSSEGTGEFTRFPAVDTDLKHQIMCSILEYVPHVPEVDK
jgi:hypothetical protein